MAMTGDLFDVCVVGAGVEGSSAARYLASWGKNILLLEQFPLPHCRGSSHGQSRLVRYGYSQSFLTAVMPEAFEMWSDIEKIAGRTLIRRCGLLTIDEPPYDDLSRVITNVRGVGQECLQLTGDEINKRFPGLNLSSLECGAFEPKSGLIQADLALKALQEQFVEFGGTLHDAEKVLDIQPGSVINIKTNKNSYRAKRVIITAGPWANNVLRPLGIQIPLSVCPHAGVSIEDADNREGPSRGFDQNYIDSVAELIKARFPGVEPKPSITESCIYSVTPDHLFVMDRHPEYKNIVIGAGFSGHGFKMAPVVGKILTQMVLGEKVSYDVFPFRLSRFTSPKSSL
ncbi:peroxisomal sarcosine oxidase-like isoform X2 [Porites lutea]|uniref:peroxisomal sarcosine oxidase-like isoform X2 n=1 Tax=Porites lutea TaxID=51062 RepID=UPI003CC5C297